MWQTLIGPAHIHLWCNSHRKAKINMFRLETLHNLVELLQTTRNTNFHKVERLWLLLLGWSYGAQHLVDVCHPPHRRAQEGWPGAHAGPQHIQQVPDVALIKLQEEAMSVNSSTRGRECESKTYPRFGICTHDSRDGPHAVCFGDEAKAGYDRRFGKGGHFLWRQLHHLTFGNVASESKQQ